MSEHELQKQIFQWAAWMSKQRWPELALMYAVPNAGKRSPAVAGMMKAEGLKKGFPDTGLPVARGGYHGLFIEYKVGKRRPSPEQKQWLQDLADQGFHAVICRSFDEATSLIADYMLGLVVRENVA